MHPHIPAGKPPKNGKPHKALSALLTYRIFLNNNWQTIDILWHIDQPYPYPSEPYEFVRASIIAWIEVSN